MITATAGTLSLVDNNYLLAIKVRSEETYRLNNIRQITDKDRLIAKMSGWVWEYEWVIGKGYVKIPQQE